MKIRDFTFLYIFCITPYTAASNYLIQGIDDKLAEYYKNMKRPYLIKTDEGDVGKFKNYCDENEFDDEGVWADLKAGPTNSFLVEFDLSFPLQADSTDKADKELQTFRLLLKFANSVESEKQISGLFPLLKDKIISYLRKGKGCSSFDKLLAAHCYRQWDQRKTSSAQEELAKIKSLTKSNISATDCASFIINYMNEYHKESNAKRSNLIAKNDNDISETFRLPCRQKKDFLAQGIGLSADQRLAAAIYEDGKVWIINIETGHSKVRDLKMSKPHFCSFLHGRDIFIVANLFRFSIFQWKESGVKRVKNIKYDKLKYLPRPDEHPLTSGDEDMFPPPTQCNKFDIHDVCLSDDQETIYLIDEPFKKNVAIVRSNQQTMESLKLPDIQSHKLTRIHYVKKENMLLIQARRWDKLILMNLATEESQVKYNVRLLAVLENPSRSTRIVLQRINEKAETDGLELFDLELEKTLLRLPDEGEIVETAIPFCNNNKLLTLEPPGRMKIWNEKSKMKIWDITNGKVERSILVDDIEQVQISDCGDFILTRNSKYKLQYYCLREGVSKKIGTGCDIFLSRDGRKAVVTHARSIRIFSQYRKIETSSTDNKLLTRSNKPSVHGTDTPKLCLYGAYVSIPAYLKPTAAELYVRLGGKLYEHGSSVRYRSIPDRRLICAYMIKTYIVSKELPYEIERLILKYGNPSRNTLSTVKTSATKRKKRAPK